MILAEQNFSNSDRADPSAAQVAKIGKALGVKYIILGSITKFGIEDKGMKIGAGAWGGGKFGVGDVGTKKGKATVAIAARMVDTTTGEIMAVAKADGTSSRSGLVLGGAANHLGGGFRDRLVELPRDRPRRGHRDLRQGRRREADRREEQARVSHCPADRVRLTVPK